MLNKVYAVCLFFIFAFIQPLNAQLRPMREYRVKAAFLYNFTRFIEWPPASFNSSEAPFVIGIIGSDPFGPSLEEIADDEKIGGHPIVVQRYHDMKNIQNCHILFINSDEPSKVKRIISSLKGRNILTVGDTDNFTKWGGMVRFFTRENKIRFEINNEAAKTAQLKISSKLLSLANIY